MIEQQLTGSREEVAKRICEFVGENRNSPTIDLRIGILYDTWESVFKEEVPKELVDRVNSMKNPVRN